MNSEYPELEKELESMRPIQGSELLKERIAQAMEITPVEIVKKTRWFDWKGVAAALVVAGFSYVAFLSFKQDDPEIAQVPVQVETPDVFQPVFAERQVLRKADEGIVVLEGKGPFRKVRYEMMDFYEWENPRNGKTYTVKKPSEQVIFVGTDMN
jgi:hypothetical protein